MAGTSGKHLLCFVHIGGRFATNGEGFVTYAGDTTRLKIIKESTGFEKFKTMICSMVGKQMNEFIMRFTVSCDLSTFVDLEDEEGMEYLLNFNEEKGNVYVEEKRYDNPQSMIEEPMREEQV